MFTKIYNFSLIQLYIDLTNLKYTDMTTGTTDEISVAGVIKEVYFERKAQGRNSIQGAA